MSWFESLEDLFDDMIFGDLILLFLVFFSFCNLPWMAVFSAPDVSVSYPWAYRMPLSSASHGLSCHWLLALGSLYRSDNSIL